MNEPIRHEEWLGVLNMSLAKNVCHARQLLPWLLEGVACHISGGRINTYLRKSNMFNSFLSLQNLFSSSGLVNMSASWSSVPTLSIAMSPFIWWSLMKWCLMSMCKTRLLVSLTALSLSHGVYTKIWEKNTGTRRLPRLCQSRNQLHEDWYQPVWMRHWNRLSLNDVSK